MEGADVNAVAKNGSTALSYVLTCQNNHRRNGFIEILIAKGADIEAQPMMTLVDQPFSVNSPVCMAIIKGDFQDVKLLLRLGANPNSVSAITHMNPPAMNPVLRRKRFPPLSVATSRRVVDIMQLLLKSGADPNARDTTSVVALHYLATAAHSRQKNECSLKSIAGILFAYEANIEAVDDEGNHLLHCLAESAPPNLDQELEDLLVYFLKNGSPIGARNHSGDSAKSIANRRGLLRVCDILDGVPATYLMGGKMSITETQNRPRNKQSELPHSILKSRPGNSHLYIKRLRC